MEQETPRIIRSWLSMNGRFQYYFVFNDGTFTPCYRSDANEYVKRTGRRVKTIIGKPEGTTWNIIGS